MFVYAWSCVFVAKPQSEFAVSAATWHLVTCFRAPSKFAYMLHYIAFPQNPRKNVGKPWRDNHGGCTIHTTVFSLPQYADFNIKF